ncbi:MAG: MBG domain-containing protein [Limisphaerales bacterium]
MNRSPSRHHAHKITPERSAKKAPDEGAPGIASPPKSAPNFVRSLILLAGMLACFVHAALPPIGPGVDLSGHDLRGANLEGANLEGANLRDAILNNANLAGANLVGANLVGADLIDAVLIYADLTYANLSAADLNLANLRGATLNGAALVHADLSTNNLSFAVLTGANLSDATLLGADLTSAILTNAIFHNTRMPDGTLRTDVRSATPHNVDPNNAVTPWNVPGRIEAENFDEGGEGVGYHDLDFEDQGFLANPASDSYRIGEGVDLQSVGVGEDGKNNIGWTEPGEWTQYTVNVIDSGQYVLDARMASGVNGGAFDLSFDGVDFARVSVPATGGWQSWTTRTSAPFSLTYGLHSMRITWRTSGANLNYVVLRPAGTDLPGLLRPGDPILAIDLDGGSGSPGGEEVSRAIDGEPLTKYLNLGGVNSGFIVTPKIGTTVVTGFTMTTANDEPSRDPSEWELFGTQDPITTSNHGHEIFERWTRIASGEVFLPIQRRSVAPVVVVDNAKAYTSYRLVFHNLIDPTALMQFAEIQFHGRVDSPLKVTPVLNWNTPAVITYGTALGPQQLDATATDPDSIVAVPGSFQYSPATGAIPGAGAHSLQVAFTPDDPARYEAVNATVTLTVQRAPLTVTATDQSREVGQPDPVFDVLYSGFAPGEGPANLTGSLAFSTTASQASPAGRYNITPSGLTSANYDIQFVQGILTVRESIPARQGPFGNNGQPWTLPGRIEAEHFDEGGEGVAYHDLDSANQGPLADPANNTYRVAEAVDLERVVAGEEGSFNIGWIDAGEWTEYTVNVTHSGHFVLDARVASATTGAAFDLSFDGVDVATVSVPGTGGWQSWITQTSAPFSLTAGPKVMRITWRTSGANLDYVALRPPDVDVPALLRPGDPILAMDLDGNSESPVGEDVSLAIDGTPLTKYLNFGRINSGFIVTPRVGPTVVTGFTMTTANDLDARDPVQWELSGTDDAITTPNHGQGTSERWTPIASGTLSLPSARGEAGDPVTFANTVPYLSYRFVVFTVKGPSNSMQFSEIQFQGRVMTPRKTIPVLTWNTPAAITYGTALRPQQLNATATDPDSSVAVPGSFQYSPATGAVPGAGAHSLQVAFTPDDPARYEAANATVTLTVQRAPLTVTATDKAREVGQPDPTFGVVYSGFAPGEGPGNLTGSLAFSTTASQASPAGRYNITPSGLTSANYEIQFVAGVLTVLEAPLREVEGERWIVTFDRTEIPYALADNGAFAPVVLPGGPTGSFLRLTQDGQGGSLSFVAFDQEPYGLTPARPLTIEFDVRVGAGSVDAADGGSLMLLPTSVFRTSGTLGKALVSSFQSEEPNLPGTFGVGIDYYPNFGSPGADDTDHAISLHWNGSKVAEAPIDRAILNWTEDVFHRVHVRLEERQGQIVALVRLTPDVHGGSRSAIEPFNGPVVIPGMTWYSYRIAFAARTGGLTSSFDIDNVSLLLPVSTPTPLRPVTLAVERSGENLWVTWPGDEKDGFVLASSPDLANGPWTLVPPRPVFRPASGTWAWPVVLQTGERFRYFRLFNE